MRRYIHAPVMTAQEAALLPAMPRSNTPEDRGFIPVEEAKAEQKPRRRGSAAGRAILHEACVSLPGVQPMGKH